MRFEVHDDRVCTLGEGPLWHPVREELFWFDILENRMFSRKGDAAREWRFGERVSAAGWVDEATLMIASETRLFAFDLESGAETLICGLEADNPATRSNDGRADPYGGFWIGTMSKAEDSGKGAIYRWHRGELRQLYAPISISNGICFTPDKRFAHFTDTRDRRLMRQALDPETGWPVGEPEVFADLNKEGLNPDGAVIDANGVLWNAQWGASRVAAFGPDGQFLRAVALAARHSTCPAFGGPGLGTMFCTSAADRIEPAVLRAEPTHGMTFAAVGLARGQAEHRVILSD